MRNDRTRARRRTSLGTVGLLVVGCVVALATTPAQADTLITVTTTADTVDSGDGLVSLREALDEAQASAVPVVITLAAVATYDLTYCTPVGGEPSHNRSGSLATSTAQSVTIHGTGSTIHQTCAGAEVIRVDPGSPTTSSGLTVDRVTIDGGHGAGAGALLVRGGLSLDHVGFTGTVMVPAKENAAVVVVGAASLVDTTVDGTQGGGGLSVSTGGGQPTRARLIRARLTGNTNAVSGGQVGGISALGPIDVDDSVISGNSLSMVVDTDFRAGGMRAAGPIVGQGNVIADNTGNVGGVTATGIGASISLQDSTISGNHGLVGGVAGPLDLNRVTLRANVGTVAGGFVGTGAIVASTVDDNDGPLAGAGYTDGFGGQSLSILRSTIADNTGGRVGGVGLDTSTAVAPGPSSQPHVSFAASTLVGNSASAADGADDLGFLNESHAPAGLPNNPNGSITTEATVFASTAGGKPSCFLDGHPVTSNGVNYSADASCGLGAGDLVDLGDPELLPLERTQASPLEVRLPGRGSVLRDQIRPGEHWCTVVDEAGIGLPQGPRCDIGAAEAVLGGFHPPFGPVRLYDSRDTHSPLAAGETRTIQVQPHQFAARMSALLVNATVVNPSADTHLTIWPSDGAEPATSNLNASAHETIANQVLVPIGTGATPGSVKVFNNAGSSDVVVDLAGFYDDGTVAPPSTVACPCGDGFAPLGMPVRLVDTRDGHGGSTTAFGPHEARTYSLGGVAGLPADAAAVALNVTITGADSSSHLSIGPGSVPSTGSSTLNWSAGETVANGATVTVPAGKDVTIYNNEGHVQVIVDVVGSYSPTAAARLRVIDPARFTDSRFTGPTGGNNPFGAGETRTFAVSSLIAPQSTGITSAWFNVTGVQASVDTHLTVWPGDVGLPATSTLNVPTHGTRANLTPVGLGSTGSIKIRNNSGQMNVIADLFGWFATNG